ncbi:MAG: amidase [Alphaproteobacteria bacterium]|nr:amidase [Alphaproteobacteria bacterium]
MSGFREYVHHDGVGLAQLIRRKQISASEVLDAALACIERHNPTLNAIIHRMDGEARAAIARGLPDGPLSGVPYALKDLNLLYAGQPCRNGSRLFADFVPDHDSTLVERYRAAGLVILGKTNTPEFGLNMSTEPLAHGPTRNPWDPARSAGGSSGGAAAAVAAGMLPLAHATDGGGSIRVPAANCGLVGLKPTRMRNPMGPDVAEGLGGLAVGHCVSRSVRDTAVLLDLTHGPAVGDPYAAPPPVRPFSAEVGAPVGKLRIGLVTAAPGGTPLHADCVAAAEDAGHLCASLGHHVEPANIEVDVEALLKALWIIFGAAARNTIELRLGVLKRALRDDDVEPVTRDWAEMGSRSTTVEYAQSIQVIHATGRRLGRLMERFDALLSPTLSEPPFPLGTVDMTKGDARRYYDDLFARLPFTPLANVSGQPAMQLPLFWSRAGLPIGVQFTGRFGDEATLIRLASQIETARPWFDRHPPIFG